MLGTSLYVYDTRTGVFAILITLDLVVVLNCEEVSVEEMWKEIEAFGISRDMLERRHPTLKEIKDLYLVIKAKK